MLELIDANKYLDVNIDSTFHLYCCFYSQPYCPSISWYKDGVKIQEQLNIRILEGGRTLEIYATPQVGGNYTCVATTPFGERSSFLNVVKAESEFDIYFNHIFLHVDVLDTYIILRSNFDEPGLIPNFKLNRNFYPGNFCAILLD